MGSACEKTPAIAFIGVSCGTAESSAIHSYCGEIERIRTNAPAPIFTNEVSEDVLYFAAAVSFSNVGAFVRIRAISPQYEWMADDSAVPQDTPINAIAGVFSQALPILPLVQPFFVKKQGRLQMQFTNSAVAPTTGGLWTWRALRLTNPITDALGTGWDYSLGFNHS